jgi:hypothetical protein
LERFFGIAPLRFLDVDGGNDDIGCFTFPREYETQFHLDSLAAVEISEGFTFILPTDSGQATSLTSFSLSPTGFALVGLCYFQRATGEKGPSCSPELHLFLKRTHFITGIFYRSRWEYESANCIARAATQYKSPHPP